MPSPKIEVRATAQGTPDLVTFFEKGQPLPPGVGPAEFEGAPLSIVLLRDKTQRTLVVGLGEKAEFAPDLFSRAAGTAIKQLLQLGARDIALDLTNYATHAGPALEGALLAAYKFAGFAVDPKKQTRGILSRLQLLVPENEVTAVRTRARDAEVVASLVNEIRGIGNLPGNMITPAILAERAAALARGRKVTLKVWNEKQLKREGFGGILAVGQGSAHPPRLLALEYRGGPKKAAPIAFIGKAVTFDTGGISIKPSAQMDEMKFDKMGGLAVLAILLAAADLKLPLNLIGMIPSAENMPGPGAYRPGDIITTRDGKTIEVLNTDAEGRILLADAIAHARLTYHPSAIIEYSTLTGACIMALGHRRAGLFTKDKKWRDLLVAAGETTGEKVWPMPIDDEYREAVRSEIATAKNSSFREGSACSSASFVKLWAEEIPFAHIDIAGTAWTTKPPGHLEGGASGFGVRLALEALRLHLAG
jgi:leucyl aminopeptidase